MAEIKTNPHTAEAETKTIAEDNGIKLEFSKLPFTGYCIKMRTDTVKLAETITSGLSEVFSDYEGCYIEFLNGDTNGNDHFATHLVFRNNPNPVHDNKIKALVNLTNGESFDQPDNGRFSYLQMAKVYNFRSSGKIFTLSDDAKKALIPFMFYVNGKPVTMKNIDNFIELRIEPNTNPIYGNNVETISVIVNNLNIIAFIRAFYGDEMVISANIAKREATFGKCGYALEYSKPMLGTNNSESIIDIIQYSIELVKEYNVKENNFGLFIPGRPNFH